MEYMLLMKKINNKAKTTNNVMLYKFIADYFIICNNKYEFSFIIVHLEIIYYKPNIL